MELEEKRFRDVIQWGQTYAEFKKMFEGYLDSCLRSMEFLNSKITPMLKLRNGNRIEIDYCDKLFILDFSIIKKANGSFIAYGKMYKVEQGIEISKEQERLIPVEDSIYVDKNYIYELKDGVFKIAKDTSSEGDWLEDFIVSVLHHSFD